MLVGSTMAAALGDWPLHTSPLLKSVHLAGRTKRPSILLGGQTPAGNTSHIHLTNKYNLKK